MTKLKKPSYDDLLAAFKGYVEATSSEGAPPYGLGVGTMEPLGRPEVDEWEAEIEQAWTVIEAAERGQ